MALREYETPDGTPFPVEWPDPEMEQWGWRWDQLHQPTPLTPLAQDFIGYKSQGMGEGAAATGRFFRRQRIFANGYAFGRTLPPSAEEVKFFQTVVEFDMARHRSHHLEEWEQVQRPEVEALFHGFLRWAAHEESLAELMARFDELAAMARRLGELHSLSWGRAADADEPLLAFCEELYGELARRATNELISGVHNQSLESALKLWDLSREALSRPAVAELLREASSNAFVAGLDASRTEPRSGRCSICTSRSTGIATSRSASWRSRPGARTRGSWCSCSSATSIRPTRRVQRRCTRA